MKQRILGSLETFSNTVDSETSSPLMMAIASDLSTSPERLRERAKLLLKEILHNYAFFDVSTIDKFTHRLIRTFAKDLKLAQNFEVVLEIDLLLHEAVSRLIDKAGTDHQLTETLLAFALEKIDQDKSWDIAIDLEKIGRMIFEENQLPHLKKLEGKTQVNFQELKQFLKKEIHKCEKNLTKNAKVLLERISKERLEFGDFRSAWFPKFILGISEGKFNVDFEAKWKQNFGEEPLYNKTAADHIKHTLDSLLPWFASLFTEIRATTYRRAMLLNAYQNIVPLTILNAIRREVKTLETERNQLPISFFNSIISNEIRNQPAPYIYERLGEKYRHYFIDEFQDTSELQWSNLLPLIGSALEGEDEQGNRGSLLLVGDAKQAIYRWRGGKAEQFLNLISLRTNPFVSPPQIEALPKNFRSREAIVSFNNAFFSSSSHFLNHSFYQNLFEEGSRQQPHLKEGGLVKIDFISNAKEHIDQEYCQQVVLAIKEARETGYQFMDICILTRKRKQGILISDFLMQEGIPIISSETQLLQSDRKVRFLVDLLKYGSDPGDLNHQYSLLEYLVSEEENTHDQLLRYLGNLTILFSDNYDFDFEYLKASSTYDGLEYAIKQFGLVRDSDAHLTYFMDTVLEVEQKEDSSISTFLAYWEKRKDKLSIVAPESLNAIQIMTIHKAKGLEFPVVIFPYANSYIYEEIEPKLWLPVSSESFCGFPEILVNKKKEVIHYGDTAAELFEQEQQHLEFDAFNLIYVALTRAVDALYIVSQLDLSAKGEHKLQYYSGLLIHFLKEKGLWNENQTTYSFGHLEPGVPGKAANLQQTSVAYGYSQKRILTF